RSCRGPARRWPCGSPLNGVHPGAAAGACYIAAMWRTLIPTDPLPCYGQSPGLSDGPRAAACALAWVKQVADAFTDEVTAQNCQEDARARHKRLPRIDFQVGV